MLKSLEKFMSQFRSKNTRTRVPKPRGCRLEFLEERALLSAVPLSAQEYADLRAQYTDFNLSENMEAMNVITLDLAEGDDLTDLKAAITTASTTIKSDLIVVRTSVNANKLTYTASTDELDVNIEASQYGSVTIVGLGSDKLTLDANRQCRGIDIVKTTSVVNLAGVRVCNGDVRKSTDGTSGGGIDNLGTLTLVNCAFTQNSAEAGGAIFSMKGSLLARNCDVSQNTSVYNGGGIEIYSGTGTIDQCTVSENSAGYNGGGIYNQGTITITNCEISKNGTTNGGGVCNSGGKSCLITNSTIAENTATSNGGGISNANTSLTVTNCTVVENYAAEKGGGIYSYNSSCVVNNSIIVENTNPSGTDNIYKASSTFKGSNNLTVYSGWSTGSGNNITYYSNYLLFKDADIGDYRTIRGSQAQDAGSNALAAQAGLTADSTDMFGNARIQDDCIDIGAYEYTSGVPETRSTVVTTLKDLSDECDGLISVREAIAYAVAGDTVTFAENLSGKLELWYGELVIDKALTIEGEGRITVDGNGNYRVFHIITDNEAVTLSGLTIQNGYVNSSASPYGAGIKNESSTLTIKNCVIKGNKVYNSSGGGIFSVSGDVTIINSCVAGNYTSALCGGIYISGGSLTVVNSTVTGNVASQYGGVHCTNLTLQNSIVSQNYAQNGVVNVYGTLSAKSRDNVIGTYVRFVEPPSFNSSGTLTNLATMDLHLRSDSVAIDIGDNSLISDFTSDLDGNSRIYGGAVDAGAYEYQGDCEDDSFKYSAVVNTLNDSFDLSDDEWSLREAIYYAPKNTDISFAENLSGTITLALGQLVILSPVSIHGEGRITIDAQNKTRVISVTAEDSTAQVTLSGLTFTNGKAPWGGGILSESDLNIIDCTISNSSTTSQYGGGICSFRSLLNITNSLITGNAAIGRNYPLGGGIYASGTCTITNCTITGNITTNKGGGIYAAGKLTMNNTIVAGNTASENSDMYAFSYSSTGSHNLTTFTGWGSGEGNLIYDPDLPLFVNAEGGDFHLVTGSQAIDQGKSSLADRVWDMEGKDRVKGEAVDIGAFEYEGFTISQRSVFNGSVEMGWLQSGNVQKLGIYWYVGAERLELATFTESGSFSWDTTLLEDAAGILKLEYFDANGTLICENTVSGTILNDPSVAIHRGTISENETWEADKIHIVLSSLQLGKGVTLTLDRNAIVKFTSHSYIQNDGTIAFKGDATLTTFEDDSVGGDTNLDGNLTAGANTDEFIRGDGEIRIPENSKLFQKFQIQKITANIASDTVWRSGLVYYVSKNVSITSGATLTIEEGAVVKFGLGCSLSVSKGTTLNAQGSVASPIVFTSLKDDEYGGDTNDDGGRYEPIPGDWEGVLVSGTANLSHVILQYAAPYNESGIVEVSSGGSVNMDSCKLTHAKYDGLWNWGGDLNVKNSIVTDVGICSAPFMGAQSFTNCTFDDSSYVLMYWSHWTGTGTYTNCVFNNVSSGWMDNQGSEAWQNNIQFQNCLFYSSNPDRDKDFAVINQNGNLWANPLFRNVVKGDYRLQAGSPCIDAGSTNNAPETDFVGAKRMDDPMVKDAGSVVDIGAYEFTENAFSEIDLEIKELNASANAETGGSLTVHYIVANAGAASAEGNWLEQIFLVSESGQKVLATEFLNQSVIHAGQNAVRCFQIQVPALTEGKWYAEVLLNPNRTLFEGANTTNNVLRAAEATTISVPLLTDETGVIRTSSKHSVLYRVEVKAGDALNLKASSTQEVSIYIQEIYAPTSANYAQKAASYAENQYTLYVSPSEMDRVFFLLAETKAGTAEISFTFERTETLDLLGVAPTTVSNSGPSTLTVSGTGFTKGMTAELSFEETTITASTVTVTSASSAAMTFDLTSKPAGKYTLRVTSPTGQTAELADALTVEQNGTGAKLEIDLQLPDAVRTGRVYTGHLYYCNTGDCDMILPIFTIQGEGVVLALNAEDLGDDTKLYVLGLGSEDSAGILRSGESGKITFYFKADSNNKISAYTWADDGMLENNVVWETWSELFTKVSEAATTLGLRGVRDFDYHSVETLAEAKAKGSANLGLAGTLTDSRNGTALANCKLTAEWLENDETCYDEALTDSNGHYVFNYLPENTTCTLSVTSGAYNLSTESVSMGTSDQTTFNLTALPYGTISGRITDVFQNKPVEGLKIYAQDENGNFACAETNSQGQYTLSGLELGTWKLTFATKGKYITQTAISATVNSSVIQTVNVPLDSGASISGTIVDSGNQPISGLTLYLSGSFGEYYETETNENGQYNFAGLSSGEYTLEVGSSSYIAPEAVTLTLVEHSGTVQNFQLAVGHTVSGTVRDSAGQPVKEVTIYIENAEGNIWSSMTDETGAWTVEGLALGEYVISLFSSNNVFNQTEMFTLTANFTPSFNLIWKATGSLSGQIVTSDGRIGQGKVTLTDNLNIQNSVRTDTNGNFSFVDLLPGIYTLTLENSDLPWSIEILAGQITIQNIDLHVKATVSGTTKDSSGNAIPNVIISVYQGENLLISTLSDSNGRYSLAFTEDGTYDFYADNYFSEGFFTTHENRKISVGDSVTFDFIEGEYTLEITDLANLPVTENDTIFILSRRNASGDWEDEEITSEKAAFEHLTNGNYKIVAKNGEYRAEKSFVVENESLQISLQFQKVNLLTIELDVPASVEVTDDFACAVYLYDSGNELIEATSWDGKENIVFQAVKNGQYRLVVLNESLGTSQSFTVDASHTSFQLALQELTHTVTGTILESESDTLLYITDANGIIQGFGCTQENGSFVIYVLSELTTGSIYDGDSERKIMNLGGNNTATLPVSSIIDLEIAMETPEVCQALSDIILHLSLRANLSIDLLLENMENTNSAINSFGINLAKLKTPTVRCSCEYKQIDHYNRIREVALNYWKTAANYCIKGLQLREEYLKKRKAFYEVTYAATMLALNFIPVPGTTLIAISLNSLKTNISDEKEYMGIITSGLEIASDVEELKGLAKATWIHGRKTSLKIRKYLKFLGKKSTVVKTLNGATKILGIASDGIALLSTLDDIHYQRSWIEWAKDLNNYRDKAEEYYKKAQRVYEILEDFQIKYCCGGDCDEDCKCGCMTNEVGNDPKAHNSTSIPQSSDPNEIAGPIGYDFEQVNEGTEDEPNLVINGRNWINGEGNQDYRIYFENKESATAAAQEIFIDMTLPETFDYSTMEFGELCIGSQVFELDETSRIGENKWLLDQKSTGEQILAQVSFDEATSKASWYLRSYVATTIDNFPDSAYDGFLPVNNENGDGEGYVTFRVRMKQKLWTYKTVTTSATIVFDTNEPIETNVWKNTIDVDTPYSFMEELPTQTNEESVLLSWVGEDEGSGVAFYDLYVSINGGNFQLVEGGLNVNEYEYTFPSKNKTYSFKVVATDNVGWVETDDLAEVTTNYGIPTDVIYCLTTIPTDLNSHVVSANESPINEWNTVNLEFWSDFTTTETFTVTYDSTLYQLNTESARNQGGVVLTFGDSQTCEDGKTTIEVTIDCTENIETGNNTLLASLEFKPISNLLVGESVESPIFVNDLPLETTVYSVIYDLDESGDVGINDLVAFARLFNQDTESNPDAWKADFDCNTKVEIQDLILFARNFGLSADTATRVTYTPNYTPHVEETQTPEPTSSLLETSEALETPTWSGTTQNIEPEPAQAAPTVTDQAWRDLWSELEDEEEERLAKQQKTAEFDWA